MAFPRPDGRVRIVPSLLAADFAAVGEAVARVEGAADWVSVDVMDGHFVPNLSFGPDLVRAVRQRSRVAIDAHLMVDRPAFFAQAFVDAGADLVIAHAEAAENPEAFFAAAGRRVGVGLALKPATSAERLLPFLKRVDLALVMTVEPGFGGQAFRFDMLDKIRALRQAIDRSGRPVWLMADGGINAETVVLAAEAGADALVAGSSVFRSADPASRVRELRGLAQEAFERGKKVVR
jgi:ribulose-phosphate 3-epimerase